MPPREGLSYIVSHQVCTPSPIPQALLERSDVIVVQIEGRGLSANRNNAIKNATADLLVLADDDICLKAEYMDNLQLLAIANPQTDVFSLQALTPEGKPIHYYPIKPFTHPHIPKGFYYNSMGLVLRGHKNYPDFDTRFGLGSERLPMGEEDVFVFECHKQGLNICYYPQPLLITSGTTTSSDYSNNPSLQQAKGAALTILHGPFKAKLKFLSTALRMRNQIPIRYHLHNLMEGMRYILSYTL